MNNLKEYLNSNGARHVPSVDYMERVVKDYPWFSMGHKLLARVSGRITPQVALMLYVQRCPAFFYKEYNCTETADISEVSEVRNHTEEELFVNDVEVRDEDVIASVPPPIRVQVGTPTLPPISVEQVDTPPPMPKSIPPLALVVPPPIPSIITRSGLNVVVDKAKGSLESEIIEKFLTSGEHKIVPKADLPKYVGKNECEESFSDSYITSRLIKSQSQIEFAPDDDDEFLTEELAEVYTNQELYKQAMKIYSRLMLIYPEKSVYFADILNHLEKERVETK